MARIDPPSEPQSEPPSEPVGSESQARPAQVFVVSDGTGDTCANAVRAAMLQFQSPWRLRIFGGIRAGSEARRVIRRALEEGALVVFSLVEKPVASALRSEARERGVGTVDLLGPLISMVAQRLHAEPRHQPGLLHGFSDDYFRRVEAVEFAVQHDDGANTHTLFQADLVLTGLSRTSKTPLSMYLAQRGYKTGNVPLVPGVDPPRALLELDRRKVFALDIDRATLLSVRQARVRALGSSPYSRYADDEALDLEIDRARRLYRQRGWRILDVSGRAVEENASRIIELYQQSSPG
ncbi:MAG: kinase/pyrophosphorylase [Proteobacteria bacterium]|nr:kinase/pyrophosphorylase [Pseudomonadota bacterium]